MPTYKLISDIVICAGWLFSLAIILMEYMKGQKHSWIVITFWVCEFLVGGIRLQVLAKNLVWIGFEFFFLIYGIFRIKRELLLNYMRRFVILYWRRCFVLVHFCSTRVSLRGFF